VEFLAKFHRLRSPLLRKPCSLLFRSALDEFSEKPTPFPPHQKGKKESIERKNRKSMKRKRKKKKNQSINLGNLSSE
jgi:hypothetical protein